MSTKPEEKERPYLRNIKVKGFKSIREMDLDLNPLNVLIGANGSGKSNFLSVFEMLGLTSEGRLDMFVGRSGGADRVLHFGAAHTDKIEILLSLENTEEYRVELYPLSGDVLSTNQTSSSPLLQNLGQVKKINDSKNMLKHINQFVVYHFNNTSRTAKIKQKCNINDCHFFNADGSNLAAYLYLLKKKSPKHYRNIVETIQLVAPFFHDFDLKPTPENADFILLEWQHKEYRGYYNADQLSDGTLRFICLTTLLLQPNLPPLILIDEPELGLHPHAISILAGLLRKAAVHTQVIVATQSVTFVNQFKTEDIIVVDRKNEESIFSRPDEEEVVRWLEDFEEYGMGDLWEKNIIGGTP